MRGRLLGGIAVLATVAVLGSACANEGPGAGGTTGPATGQSPSASPVPQFTTLQKGELSVGSCLDYKPFEFTNPSTGKLTGFDVEMMEDIGRRLGLKVVWVKANFNTIFNALDANKFDAVAAASTITPERQQVVNFSSPYFSARQSLTVNTTKTPDIKTTDDLKSGEVVGVQRGTTGAAWAQKNLASKGIQIKTYVVAPDAFTDLENGRITGVINDEGSSLAEAATRSGLKVVQAIDTGEHYGFAVAKSNPGLLKAINAALAAMIHDGTYAKIFKKWFPENPVPPEFQG